MGVEFPSSVVYFALFDFYLQDNRNMTVRLLNFSRVMDVNKMVLWQTIILVICYIAAFSYDRTHDADEELSRRARRRSTWEA